MLETVCAAFFCTLCLCVKVAETVAIAEKWHVSAISCHDMQALPKLKQSSPTPDGISPCGNKKSPQHS